MNTSIPIGRFAEVKIPNGAKFYTMTFSSRDVELIKQTSEEQGIVRINLFCESASPKLQIELPKDTIG